MSASEGGGIVPDMALGSGDGCSSSGMPGAAGSVNGSLVPDADGSSGSDGGDCSSSTGTSQMAMPVITATSTISALVRPGVKPLDLPASSYSFAMRHLTPGFPSPGGIIANLQPG